MRKFMFSLSGGLIIGLILSFIFWDYQGPAYEFINRAGADQTIYEWDFDFVYNSSLLVIAIIVLIYLTWTYIDKKRDEKFLEEFNRHRESEKSKNTGFEHLGFLRVFILSSQKRLRIHFKMIKT